MQFNLTIPSCGQQTPVQTGWTPLMIRNMTEHAGCFVGFVMQWIKLNCFVIILKYYISKVRAIPGKSVTGGVEETSSIGTT